MQTTRRIELKITPTIKKEGVIIVGEAKLRLDERREKRKESSWYRVLSGNTWYDIAAAKTSLTTKTKRIIFTGNTIL